MHYIKRKTNVRRHDRECRHKVADVRMHERNLKPRRILGVIPLKNLTYPQAKTVFPSLEPYGDIDEDKVINKRDCRPFDVERQDEDERYEELRDRILMDITPLTGEEQEEFDTLRNERREKEKFDYEKHTGFSQPEWDEEN